VFVVVWEVEGVSWSKRLRPEKGTDGLVLWFSSEMRVVIVLSLLSVIVGIELSSDTLRPPDG